MICDKYRHIELGKIEGKGQFLMEGRFVDFFWQGMVPVIIILNKLHFSLFGLVFTSVQSC